MGGAFSFAQGAPAPGDPAAAPLFFAPGRMSASWAGLALFAGVIADNLSRFMRLYGESAALRLQVCQFPKRSLVFFKHYFVFYHCISLFYHVVCSLIYIYLYIYRYNMN